MKKKEVKNRLKEQQMQIDILAQRYRRIKQEKEADQTSCIIYRDRNGGVMFESSERGLFYKSTQIV